MENPDAEKEGFYLCELQGFVCVYLADRSTIYEFTEIPVTDLPEEVQQEVAEGKYVGDSKGTVRPSWKTIPAEECDLIRGESGYAAQDGRGYPALDEFGMSLEILLKRVRLDGDR